MSAARIPGADEAKAYLARFNFFERYVHGPEEGEVYLNMHARRFVETLRRLPPLPPRPKILELGAVPYSMTILLRHYVQAEVTPLSFYEVEQPQSRHILESPDRAERYEFDYQAVNVEREVYPLPDAAFDLVMCCEILEHLLINPSHMLFEAHRVLKPGGHILISTPNVARAANVRALTEGRNINDAYHGNGIYGRHNREFAKSEVALLLESCGYSVTANDTVDVYDSTLPGSAPGREDTIFTTGRATGQRRVATPAALYVLMDEYLNVIRNGLTMGIDDVGHLGRGWYDLEHDGAMGFRWTRDRAVFHLHLGHERSVRLHAQVHHPDLAARPVTATLSNRGRHVGQQQIADHRWQDVVFPLPERMAGAYELELAVDRDWTPGPADARRLGIRVHRCWAE